MKFLTRLDQQMEQMGDSEIAEAGAAIDKEINTGDYREELLGELPRELKKFWALINSLIMKLDQERKDHVEMHRMAEVLGKDISEECEEKHQTLNAAERRIKVLNSLFWEVVRDAFPESEKKSTIGLRNGWLVVMSNESGGSLSRLLGFGG